MNYRNIGLLTTGHMATDINQGALPAMLPFFIAAYDLSYAAAAGLVFAVNMTSTIVQPLFGHAADRWSKPWLLPTGLLLAGMGLALSGLSTRYSMIVILAVVSGIGIAAYHPEAARLVHLSGAAKQGAAMSIFGTGGTVGFALGPLIITAAMLQWGLNGTLVLSVPVAIMALVLAKYAASFASLDADRGSKQGQSSTKARQDNWWAFLRLTLTVIGRSILFYGLNTFIPIYWINYLNQSKAAGAMALAIFAGSGIIGNLAGGTLSDKIGQKRVILAGLLSLMVLFPLMVWAKDAQVAVWLLIPIGFALYATYSPAIVLGQYYLPTRIGLSSGVTLGVAVAIGGGATPLLGWLADLHGIWTALASIACLPLFIFVMALSLPDIRKSRPI